MGYFADHIGVRGDSATCAASTRTTLGFDTGDNLRALRFWRASVGVVFR